MKLLPAALLVQIQQRIRTPVECFNHLVALYPLWMHRSSSSTVVLFEVPLASASALISADEKQLRSREYRWECS